MNIEIKKISIQEVDTLREIGITTFLNAFAKDNDPEDMQEYIESSFSIEHLTSELNNPESEFYFAVDGEEPMGYLKVNFGNAQNELKSENSLELERIYVLEKFQRRKVGQQFFNKTIEIAKAKKVDFIWLGVWEENIKAINFYKKNGFEAFDKHSFFLGKDEQTDLMMRLVLT